ncbi:hypothetical protein GO986_03305 [Deinococcus sp. HMF7620]|uniref:Uncharacterized protein n=1 Tax=Deinococcus arboris TaxID=2682977 RepID=A0A7C9HQ62_9DEIO|nr:hypothetical protein [Deinococcus arboris]MVN85787.1 hypothetical protein [Deinococcus arboris]
MFDLSLLQAKDLAHQGVYGLTLNDYQEQVLLPLVREALKEEGELKE